MIDRSATYPDQSITLHPGLRIDHGGETIAASRYEPSTDGPHPAVVIATPYRKDDRITFGAWDPSIRYLTTNGYEVVVMDLLGTGASTGWKEPFSGDEGQEVAAVIEWIAEQPWCTGAVGTYGLSYGAWTQYQVAAIDPDPLAAILPVSVVPSVYASSWTGGSFNLLKRATWPVSMYASQALPPSRRDEAGRWADIWDRRLGHIESADPWLFSFLEHPTKDAFWQHREVSPADISVPTFAACGYRDVHTRPMVEFIEAIDAPRRLIIGPWQHSMPEQGWIAAIDFRRQAVAWLDRHLKGDAASMTPSTRDPVIYWTERDGGWTAAGHWRTTSRWPTTDDDTVTFALTPSGLKQHPASTDGTLAWEYEYDHAVGVDSLDRVGSVINTGIETATDDARSLVFETSPLSNPFELTGTGEATVRIQATTPDPIVAIRLVDVTPRGRTRLVTGGYLKADHRTGHEDPTGLDPEQTYAIDIPLKPKSHVFESGHRIRVAVGASAFPRTRPPNQHGSFTLHSTPDVPSTVTLPGRSHTGDPTFANTIEMYPPDESVPLTSPFIRSSDATWATNREHATNSVTFETETESTVDLPHGPVFRRSERIEGIAHPSDPDAARLRTDATMELVYPEQTISAEATADVTGDHQSLTTTVTTDERILFDERWRRHRR
ncbi:MAG: CocE/NonD family hydrolase [Halobacteriales archaeon]